MLNFTTRVSNDNIKLMKKNIIFNIALCSIVAMLTIPLALSAKILNEPTKAEANAEDCYWNQRFNELKTKDFKNGLKLIDFKYIGKVTTEKQKEDFKKLCLDNKTYMMYCPDSRYLRYKISTIKEIKTTNPSVYKYFEGHLNCCINRIKLNEAEIVKLKWEYNGKQFETYAAVTNSTLNWTGGEGTIANKKNLEYLIFENMLMPLQVDKCSIDGTMFTFPYVSLS